MKIAVIQMLVGDDKLLNLDRACVFVAQAAQGGAQVAVLPEMFNCPYKTENFPVYAEKAGGHSWQRLSDAARQNDVYVVGGSLPEADDAGRVFNSSYVFDRKGRQIGKHRKAHMFDIDIPGGQRFKESETLTPGNEVTTFETEFGVMGLAICYDFRFPEISRIMVDRGAHVIFVPAAFNMTTGPAHWEILFRCRAQDYQCFTVGVSPARNDKGCYVSYANSIVASPWGDILMKMEEDEGIGFCNLDFAYLKKVRKEFPLRSHFRKKLYEEQAIL